MNLTERDFNETSKIAGYLAIIDKIDAKYVDRVSDQIFQKQPFLLTVFLGYRLDISPEEFEEMMKIYFLIWEYFKDNKGVQTKKITEAQFEKIYQRHINMFQYAGGEQTQQDVTNIYAADLQNLRSKALLTAILFRFNTIPLLREMDDRKKGGLLVDIKSFIECFEEL